MPEGQSALLVPVPEAEPVVGSWRELYDPSATLGVPAHVTLLYPFVPRSLVDDALLTVLTELFSGFRPFNYRFPKSARFPGVIYLAPEPVPPFKRLISALGEAFPEYPPYRGAHPDVIPHLTVADRRDRLDLVLMNRVEQGLAPGLPFAARAQEVWLMTERRKRWSRKARFALGVPGVG